MKIADINPVALYPISKIAAMTGTRHNYIRSLIDEGELVGYRVGRGDARYRVLGANLIAFLERMGAKP